MGSQVTPSRTGANHRSTAAGLAIVALIALLYTDPVYRLVGPQTVLWLYNLTVLAAASAGLYLSFLLWRSFTPGEASRSIWGCLALGLGLWVAGEALWSYDQLLGGRAVPVVSAADAAWVIGFIPLTLGLYLRYRSFQITPRKPWQLAMLWSFIGLAALAALVAVVSTLTQGGGSFLDQAANILYPIADLIIAFQALLLVLVLAGGSLSFPWALIASGFLSLAVSDILYVFSTAQGSYEAIPVDGVNLATLVVNVLYLVGYVMVALGLYRQARIQNAL
jgi:hypothetical protein